MDTFVFDIDKLIEGDKNECKIYTMHELDSFLSSINNNIIDRFNYLWENIHLIGGIDVTYDDINIYTKEGYPERPFTSFHDNTLNILIPFKLNISVEHIHYLSFQYDQSVDRYSINLHAYYFNHLINNKDISASIASIHSIRFDEYNNVYVGDIDLTSIYTLKKDMLEVGYYYNYNIHMIINILHFMAKMLGVNIILLTDNAHHHCSDGLKFLISFALKLADRNFYFEKYGYQKISNNIFIVFEKLVSMIRSTPINNYLRYFKMEPVSESITVGEFYKNFFEGLELNRYQNPDFGCSYIATITNNIFNMTFIPGIQSDWFNDNVKFLTYINKTSLFFFSI